MADHRFDCLTLRLSGLMDRRATLRALTASLGGILFMGDPPSPTLARRGRHNNGNRRRNKERQRLRQQCRKQCQQVQRDCRFVCRNLGNPDDICHPQCAAARRGCKRGC